MFNMSAKQNEIFCSIHLFLRDGLSTKSKHVWDLFANLDLINVEVGSGNIAFDMEGVPYENIKDLFAELLNFLSDDKRSQATVFEDEDIRCLVYRDQELQEAA